MIFKIISIVIVYETYFNAGSEEYIVTVIYNSPFIFGYIPNTIEYMLLESLSFIIFYSNNNNSH